jgi:lipopolysaccharide transport system permease protein
MHQRQITTIVADAAQVQAMRDLITGLKRVEMWWSFAVFDIKQRFRRSVIGPLWLTLSMSIMVGALSLVFSKVFQQRMSELLPYIAVGLIFWNFLATSVTEGALVFVNSNNFIRNVPMELSVHVYRMVARNVIVLGFNMLIYMVMVIVFPHPHNFNYLLVIFGFAIFLLNVLWISFSLAIVSARFRDIPQIATNLLQVVFFVTPIFWTERVLPTRPAFISWNPAYYLIDIVRSPLLGKEPSMLSWGLTVSLCILGCCATWLLYNRAYARIPYWV